MSLHIKLNKPEVSSPKGWDKVKRTARGHGANSRNAVAAPGDLLYSAYHLHLEL